MLSYQWTHKVFLAFVWWTCSTLILIHTSAFRWSLERMRQSVKWVMENVSIKVPSFRCHWFLSHAHAWPYKAHSDILSWKTRTYSWKMFMLLFSLGTTRKPYILLHSWRDPDISLTLLMSVTIMEGAASKSQWRNFSKLHQGYVLWLNMG